VLIVRLPTAMGVFDKVSSQWRKGAKAQRKKVYDLPLRLLLENYRSGRSTGAVDRELSTIVAPPEGLKM
jgi:hypothetical protein